VFGGSDYTDINGSLWKSFAFFKKKEKENLTSRLVGQHKKTFIISRHLHLWSFPTPLLSFLSRVSIDITQTKRKRLQGSPIHQGFSTAACLMEQTIVVNHKLHFVFLSFFLSFFLSSFLSSPKERTQR
jgi:hypothetical protein